MGSRSWSAYAAASVALSVAAVVALVGCGGGDGGGGGGGNPPPPPTPDQMTWTVTDLGTFGGATSQALDVNEQGDVVGDARLANNDAHAFLEASPLTDLGTLGGDGHSSATEINDAGLIVGWSWAPGTTTRHAVMYAGGVMSDLFPGSAASALAVNSAGQIVGVRGDEAFLRSGTTTTNLGTLGGATSQARDINDQGVIVGWAELADGTTERAFVYQAGQMADIGTLGGTNSRAYGVNSQGWVAGDSQTAGNASDWPPGHGFIFRNGTMTDIGTLGGAKSHADAINDEGVVVGEAMLADDTTWHAFAYFDGEMTDLNDRLAAGFREWTLEQARGINEARQIVGVGTTPEGDRHAYLATPR